MAPRDPAPAGIHGGTGRPTDGARRAVTGWQTDQPDAQSAAAWLLLAARSLLRCPQGRLLLQTAQREVVPLVRDRHRRLRPGPAHRRTVRRSGPHLSARRAAHHLLDQPRAHLRALHAADQRVRVGPLRPRRQECLPHLAEQRAGLPALGNERRPDPLHPLGVHRQAPVAGAGALDRAPGRHAGGHVLGQPDGLARSAQGRPQHSRQPAGDVHR